MKTGGFIAGVVSIATLVVIGGIVYQLGKAPNTVPAAKVAVGGATTITKTLYKG